eukprot:s4739_g4.t1
MVVEKVLRAHQHRPEPKSAAFLMTITGVSETDAVDAIKDTQSGTYNDFEQLNFLEESLLPLPKTLVDDDQLPACGKSLSLGTSSVTAHYWLKDAGVTGELLPPVGGTHAHELSMVSSAVFAELDNKAGVPLSQIISHMLYFLHSRPWQRASGVLRAPKGARDWRDWDWRQRGGDLAEAAKVGTEK